MDIDLYKFRIEFDVKQCIRRETRLFYLIFNWHLFKHIH